MESELVRQHFDLPVVEVGGIAEKSSGMHVIQLLNTGIGMVNTVWHLGRQFMQDRPDMAINFGIAGAFQNGPDLLQVVEVIEDCYGDLGTGSPQGFQSLEQMGFAHFKHDGRTYYNKLQQPRQGLDGIWGVRGITVNRVTGDAGAIAEMERLWNPEVETMEGAAFFQACILENVPFRALRGISNRVEPRNRAAWRVKEAIENVQQHLLNLLQQVNQPEPAL
jgi:futalosine hydrolase